MIYMEIIRNLAWGGLLSQPVFSGSRQSVKNPFLRAHLVAKGIRPTFMPGVD